MRSGAVPSARRFQPHGRAAAGGEPQVDGVAPAQGARLVGDAVAGLGLVGGTVAIPPDRGPVGLAGIEEVEPERDGARGGIVDAADEPA